MFSILKSAVSTENSIESLISNSFPSSHITDFSVRQIPLKVGENENYFQGILVEKYNDNSLNSVNIDVVRGNLNIPNERKDEILNENNKSESKEKTKMEISETKAENTEKYFTDLKKGNKTIVGGEEKLMEKGMNVCLCMYL
jgi:hypothetical protein